MEPDENREFWRAYKDHMRSESRAKKQHNLAYSTNLLRQNNVRFTSSNQYVHCVVEAGDSIVDFWPSTGLWIIRGSTEQHRGVYKLLRFCKKGIKP